MKKHVGMVAGGTGITPMLQVAEAILDNDQDKTKISLVFANVTEGDIILKKELDAYKSKYPDRFDVYYVLDKPGFFWKGGKGYVTKDMLQKHMPPPGPDNMVSDSLHTSALKNCSFNHSLSLSLSTSFAPVIG